MDVLVMCAMEYAIRIFYQITTDSWRGKLQNINNKEFITEKIAILCTYKHSNIGCCLETSLNMHIFSNNENTSFVFLVWDLNKVCISSWKYSVVF